MDAEDTTSSGKLFQTFGVAAGNAPLPMVYERTGGTDWRSVIAEQCVLQPSVSATWTSGCGWLRIESVCFETDQTLHVYSPVMEYAWICFWGSEVTAGRSHNVVLFLSFCRMMAHGYDKYSRPGTEWTWSAVGPTSVHSEGWMCLWDICCRAQ